MNGDDAKNRNSKCTILPPNGEQEPSADVI